MKSNQPLSVVVAEEAGFCAGVSQAVKRAYKLAEEAHNHDIYMLGELIHNQIVIDELIGRGMRLAFSPDDIPDGAMVLIRAHGVTPAQRQSLAERGCTIVDATCGFVNKIHRIVRKAWKEGQGILLTGDPAHPEIVGINGECEGEAIVFTTPEEAAAFIPEEKPYILASQTTYSVQDFQKTSNYLKNKIASLTIFDTICGATENRQAEADRLAKNSDVMIVIGSRTSSNTKKLVSVCESATGETYLIETPDDARQLLESGKLRNKRVGVTAGASSPESIIREVIHIMSENEVQTSNTQEQEGDISFSDFIEQIPELRRGLIVKGVIVRHDDDFVYVDVRDKSEGKIPRREFDNNPDFDLEKAIADREPIDVYVRSIKNTDQGKEIILSKAHVDFAKYKAIVEEAYNEKTPILVKVVNIVKDGVIATYGGVDIYIHRTQLELGTVDDLEPYRDQSFDILVTQYDPQKRRLRVSGSRRALLNRERKAKAEDLWDNIAVGDIYDGIVRSLTDFGAFVDIGGVDGLVHISELSWEHIKHPSDVVSVGQQVQVYVKDFERERKRISLGYKRIEDDPYHNIEERYPVGNIVHGKVVRMFNFGAFVELDPGVDALCHVSQISTMRLNRPEDALTIGQEVDARVLDVNNDSRRISISIRDVQPIDPAEGTFTEQPESAGRGERGGRRRGGRDNEPKSYQDAGQVSTIGAMLKAAGDESEMDEDDVEAEQADEAIVETPVADEAAAEETLVTDEAAEAEESADETAEVEESAEETADAEEAVEEAPAVEETDEEAAEETADAEETDEETAVEETEEESPVPEEAAEETADAEETDEEEVEETPES